MIRLEEFKIGVEKTFSKEEKIQLEKIYDELTLKGEKVGKPLGYSFFREKKIKNKRIYFLVYEDIVLILLVAVSSKKNQQKTINKIKELLFDYKKFIYKKFI